MLKDQDVDEVIYLLREEIAVLKEMLLSLAGVVVLDIDFENHLILAQKITTFPPGTLQ